MDFYGLSEDAPASGMPWGQWYKTDNTDWTGWSTDVGRWAQELPKLGFKGPVTDWVGTDEWGGGGHPVFTAEAEVAVKKLQDQGYDFLRAPGHNIYQAVKTPEGTYQLNQRGQSFLEEIAPFALPFLSLTPIGALLGGGITGALGIGASAATNAAIGNTLLNAALSGGNFADNLLKGAITAGIGSLAAPVANTIGSSVFDATQNQILADIASGAVRGGASALPSAIRSGEFGNVLTGAISGGVGSGVGSALEDVKFSDNLRANDAIIQAAQGLATEAVKAGLTGQDINVTGALLPTVAQGIADEYKLPLNQVTAGLQVASNLLQGKALSPADVLRFGSTFASGAKPPSGQAASVGYGGADQGYFDEEQEIIGLPSWAIDPYAQETKPGEYYAGLDKIIDEWDEADIIPDTYDTAPKTTMSPNDMAKFLEANIDDPGTVDTLMQDYFPDLYRQSIGVTGTLPKADVIIPDWDVLPDAVTPPRSIRDIGDITKVSPDEPLDGTKIVEPDLSVGLPPAVVSPAPKPATPGKAPTPSPAPKAESEDPNMAWLAALLGMLGQQQPTQAPAPLQTARIDTESPFGLMYGMRG